jgi:hypothetical protein
VFIAGSQIDSGNQMVASRGVLEEFRIATELKRIVILAAQFNIRRWEEPPHGNGEPRAHRQQ